jgi:hypothetical protein
MERLASGKAVTVRLPKDVSTLTLRIEDDDFLHFDRIFSKLWKRILKTLEKAAK